MAAFVIPSEPVRIALIGTGNRSRTVYAPLLPWLKQWVNVVAVCDPVRDHADEMADRLGVPAFYDIHKLVEARPMEAALIVTPVPSHYAISVFLSSHGIHNLAETTWCNLIMQAENMIQVTRDNRVVVRVGENFFRFPIDRIVRRIKDSGFLGQIGRVISYNDHTGYHNNSRWIAFAGAHPVSVQSVEHTIPTAAFNSTPERYHTTETYRARFFMFADNLMVMDHASNIKGFLGRQSRPGYTEWQGEKGTIVYRATPGTGWNGEGEVRYGDEEALKENRGLTDQTFPIVMESEAGRWKRIYVDLPTGRLEYANPFFEIEGDKAHHSRNWYGIPVAEHIVDFALAVRGLRPSEFTDHDALASLMMEAGALESVLRDSCRVPLPLTGETQADSVNRKKLKEQWGADPLDVEAMLAISYPKP